MLTETELRGRKDVFYIRCDSNLHGRSKKKVHGHVFKRWVGDSLYEFGAYELQKHLPYDFHTKRPVVRSTWYLVDLLSGRLMYRGKSLDEVTLKLDDAIVCRVESVKSHLENIDIELKHIKKQSEGLK